jgi:hypothetical protein
VWGGASECVDLCESVGVFVYFLWSWVCVYLDMVMCLCRLGCVSVWTRVCVCVDVGMCSCGLECVSGWTWPCVYVDVGVDVAVYVCGCVIKVRK